MSDRVDSLYDRITDYLAMGGLFNPELANHNAVRSLIIDLGLLLSDMQKENT